MRTIYDRKSRCIKYFEYFLPYAHRAANGAMSLLFDKSLSMANYKLGL